MLINIICDHIDQRVKNGELNNDDLVQLIELTGSYLNLQTVADYAKKNNLSYNGARNFRKTIKIFGVKFIIENE
jgi:hypothetical protein